LSYVGIEGAIAHGRTPSHLRYGSSPSASICPAGIAASGSAADSPRSRSRRRRANPARPRVPGRIVRLCRTWSPGNRLAGIPRV